MPESVTKNITASTAAQPVGEQAHQPIHVLAGQLRTVTDRVHDFIAQIWGQFEAATSEEILTAFALPLLAGLFGIRLARWVRRLPRTGFVAWLSDFAAPLFVPGIALIFAGAALTIFRDAGAEPVILAFEAKLALAWLAMQFVLLMSSRQAAGWVIMLVIVPITLLHLFDLWDPLAGAMKNVSFTVGEAQLTLFSIFKTLTALLLLIWLTNATLRLTNQRLKRMRRLHISNRMLIVKICQIVLYFIVFLIGLRILGVSLTTLSVFGGALGVGIGFGLQKIASNFISGIILLFEKSIEIGDLIELSDGTLGFVRQTGARFTRVEIIDGREIFIPNEELISQRIINWTHSHSRGRVEIPVVVAHGTDIEKAIALMLDAARKCPKCLPTPEPLAYATAFAENGMQLLLYFWIADMVDGRIGPRSEVIARIHQSFRDNGITLALPQRVVIAKEPAKKPAKAKKS